MVKLVFSSLSLFKIQNELEFCDTWAKICVLKMKCKMEVLKFQAPSQLIQVPDIVVIGHQFQYKNWNGYVNCLHISSSSVSNELLHITPKQIHNWEVVILMSMFKATFKYHVIVVFQKYVIVSLVCLHMSCLLNHCYVHIYQIPPKDMNFCIK